MQPTGLTMNTDSSDAFLFVLPNCFSSASKNPEASDLPPCGIKAAVCNIDGNGYLLPLDLKPKL